MNVIGCATYFDFLDNLRDSGRINMIFAGKPLQKRFDLEKDIASSVLAGWMKTYEPELSAHERAAIYLRMVGA